jgi:hypothetical protein
VHVVVLLLVGRRVVQERLHHGLLAHSVLGHGRSELSGTRIHRLHRDVVDGPLVDVGHILHVIRHTLIDRHGRRSPHPLGDLPQGGPVLGVQVPEPFQRSISDLGSLGRGRSLGGEPGHLGHGLLLHPAELLCMCRGLRGHCVAQGTLALAAPHDFRGYELHVGHARFGAVRRAAQLHLFELRVVDSLLHVIVGFLDTPEL